MSIVLLHKLKVGKGCNHINRKSRHYYPHYYSNFSPFEYCLEPTINEIKKYKLWKAPCGHWMSFIGYIATKSKEGKGNNV